MSKKYKRNTHSHNVTHTYIFDAYMSNCIRRRQDAILLNCQASFSVSWGLGCLFMRRCHRHTVLSARLASEQIVIWCWASQLLLIFTSFFQKKHPCIYFHLIFFWGGTIETKETQAHTQIITFEIYCMLYNNSQLLCGARCGTGSWCCFHAIVLFVRSPSIIFACYAKSKHSNRAYMPKTEQATWSFLSTRVLCLYAQRSHSKVKRRNSHVLSLTHQTSVLVR